MAEFLSTYKNCYQRHSPQLNVFYLSVHLVQGCLAKYTWLNSSPVDELEKVPWEWWNWIQALSGTCRYPLRVSGDTYHQQKGGRWGSKSMLQTWMALRANWTVIMLLISNQPRVFCPFEMITLLNQNPQQWLGVDKTRVFKFSRCPAQNSGYFNHLCQVLFVFQILLTTQFCFTKE